MIRDIPYIMGGLMLGIVLIILTGHYYNTSINQESIILDMNETVRSTAIANANLRSRTSNGELFIVKSTFEEEVVEKMSSDYSSLSDEAVYEFEYLDNETGSVKAIRLKANDQGQEYQTTVVVDIAE